MTSRIITVAKIVNFDTATFKIRTNAFSSKFSHAGLYLLKGSKLPANFKLTRNPRYVFKFKDEVTIFETESSLLDSFIYELYFVFDTKEEMIKWKLTSD